MRSAVLSLTILAAMPLSLGVVSLVRSADDASLDSDSVTCRWVRRDVGADTMECGPAADFRVTSVASLASLRY